MGNAHAAKGDLRAAQEAFAKAIEADPKFTPGRVALGNVYNLEKKPEDAIKEFDAALTQNPRDQRAVTAKIATLIQQERVDEAIAVAQAAVQTDPKSAAAHELLGRLYALKRNTPAAEKALTAALQLDERFVPARLTLARLAVANGKPADAVPQLQRVLKEAAEQHAPPP